MKMRTVIGGVIVVAFVVGGFLGGLFPQLGFGPGGGGGRGEPGSGGIPKSKKHLIAKVANRSDKTEETDSRVLHVLIDGRSYFLVKADGDHPVPLDELLEQVQYFPGDRQGTRVRVSRKPSSKTTAEIQLRDSLVKAGLSEDEIDWQDGPRP